MSTPHQFKVGDLATAVGYSDRSAGYIIQVSTNGKRVEFQYANAELINGVNSNHPDKLTFTPGGFCGHVEGEQIWKITPGSNRVETYSLRKNGKWKLKDWPLKSPGGLLVPGHSHWYDFNF